VYSPGPSYAMGESGSHDGDRTKLLGGKPGFTNGAYDPTDLYSSEAYDTTALNALGHCCNPLSNSTSPNETSLAIVSAGAMSGSDITGFQNTYPYLATNWQQFFIDGRATAPDIEGTLDVWSGPRPWPIASARPRIPPRSTFTKHLIPIPVISPRHTTWRRG
jgi:hypothetical protein